MVRRREVRSRARRLRSGAARWWWTRSRRQALAVLATVALLCVAAGMATAALITAREDDTPRAGIGEPLPGATVLGPLSLVLPESAGPWVPVSADRMAQVRSSVESDGLVLDGGWAVVGPDGLLVTVLTVEPGTHGGSRGLAGPFDGEPVDVPWRGRTTYAAGAQVVDGVREVALAVDHPDGHLVLLSISGDVELFSSGELDDALATVRVAPA